MFRHGLAVIGGALVVSAVIPQSAPAAAIPVDITGGGFTNFIGQSAGTAPNTGCTYPSPLVQGWVAGVQVQAPVCTAASGGLYGPASLTFASALRSVDFHEAGFLLGRPPANGLEYVAPTATQTISELGGLFLLGSIQFTNGTWFGVGTENSFHLDITADSSDPSFGIQTMSTDLVLDIRVDDSPTASPPDNADCVYLRGFENSMGSFCVNEGATGSAALLGKHGSLVPVAWTNVSGGFVLGPTPTIPEPATLYLVGLGVCLAALRTKGRGNAGGRSLQGHRAVDHPPAKPGAPE
jgi:hypothetical protein